MFCETNQKNLKETARTSEKNTYCHKMYYTFQRHVIHAQAERIQDVGVVVCACSHSKIDAFLFAVVFLGHT